MGSSAVLFAVDAQGVFTASEGEGLSVLGLEPGEVVGRSAFEIYGGEPEILGNLRRVLSGESFSCVVEVAGTPFGCRYDALRDGRGNVVGAMGLADPILGGTTGGRAAGHRTLFETGAAGMLLVRAGDGAVIEANAEAGELLGLTERKLLARRLSGLFDAPDPRFASAMEEWHETGGFKGRLRMLREDGSSFSVDASLAEYEEDGEERLAVVFREPAGREAVLEKAISELEEGRRSLAVSERLFRITFDEAAIGMAHVSADGRWLRVNGALCSILGYRRDELLSLGFQDITHPDDLGKDLEHVEKMLAGEIDSYRIEKRYIKKGGARVWADLRVSLIRQASGEIQCFVAAVEDITDLKLKELVSEPLSDRELEVLKSVAEWKTDKQIASDLGYSVATVKRDTGFIRSKLGVEGRREAVSRAVELGIIGPVH